MTIPIVEQRTVALQRANLIRMARAALKRELRSLSKYEARDRALAVMADPPDLTRGMGVHTLMASAKRCGPTLASRVLLRVMVRESRAIGDLTANQIDRIAHEWRRMNGVCPECAGQRRQHVEVCDDCAAEAAA